MKFAGQNRNIVIPDGKVSVHNDNRVIEEIAKEIEKLGYKVNCNIGCSQYKIDIGIVDPENPDSYLLGILADGENCKIPQHLKIDLYYSPMCLQVLAGKLCVYGLLTGSMIRLV